MSTRSSPESGGANEVVGNTPHLVNVRDGASQVSDITDGTNFDRTAQRFLQSRRGRRSNNKKKKSGGKNDREGQSQPGGKKREDNNNNSSNKENHNIAELKGYCFAMKTNIGKMGT